MTPPPIPGTVRFLLAVIRCRWQAAARAFRHRDGDADPIAAGLLPPLAWFSAIILVNLVGVPEIGIRGQLNLEHVESPDVVSIDDASIVAAGCRQHGQ